MTSATKENIREEARGRWPNLLPQLGVPLQVLSGKNQPCPMCGGKDRFRWTDHEAGGGYWCNKCGAGDGFDLLMKLHKIDFYEARTRVKGLLPTAPVVLQRASRKNARDFADFSLRSWRASHKIIPGDPAALYLARRGCGMSEFPSQLRYHPSVKYVEDQPGEKKVELRLPALVANFVAPDASSNIVQYTFLKEDGAPADVAVKKKHAPGLVPKGGAVRLAPSAEEMGIAEGVITALSAQKLHGLPVWSALSDGGMVAWEPPSNARKIVIFGDNDSSFAGQMAAYALAKKLRTKGLDVEVRFPLETDTDWNDELRAIEGFL